MILRPYQQEAYNCTLDKFETVDTALCVLATGLGKCLKKDTPILMYNGTIANVQDIEVGDFLMGPDSNPREVISLARGREMMYRITPKKGDSYTVNESHILSLKLTPARKNYNHRVNAGDGKIYEDGDIANICVKDYLKSSKTFKHRAKGYRVGVEFPRIRERLYTPPYILGLWLGDGAARRPQITTADIEIVAELQKYATSEHLKLTKLQQCGKAYTYSISQYTRHPGENPLLVDLQMLHLLQNKHIPLVYKTSSRKERLEILAGILDTDGYFFEGGYEFTNKSKRLAEDTAFVARSLGLAASIKRVFKTCTNNGVTGIYYKVYISGETSIVPCRIKRKQAPKRKQKKDVLVTGIKVEKIGVGDYYGFELVGKDRRFLLGDFTVVHNTVYAAHLINHFRKTGRIMMLAHRAELIYQADNHIQNICDVESDIEMGDEWATIFDTFKADVVVSTVQTQIAGRDGGRMTRFNPKEFSLLIIDEAHHAPAETYKRIIKYYKQNPDLKILGLTATPDRTDKKAMGQIFEEVTYAYDIRDGIDDGWLVPIEQQSVFVKGLDYSTVKTTAGDLNGKDLANVLEFEETLHGIADPTVQLTGDKKALVFAASVVHAERLTEIINRHKPASARFVCGTTPKETRRVIFKDFAEKTFQYLINVGVATEGFDDPSIEVIVMARPTKSRTLYAQQAGRGTRPLPGIVDLYPGVAERREAIANSAKKHLEIMDFVGNAGRHKLITSADILGGRYTDEVVELAKKNAENESNERKKPVDIISELQKAEREIAKKHQQAEDAISRDHLLLRAKYSTAKINPFNVLDIDPKKEAPWHKDRIPTSGQVKYLEKCGVAIDGLTFTHASQIIDTVIKRREQGICTYKQARCLQKVGYDTTEMDFRRANKLIGALAAVKWQKWKLPKELRP